MGDLVSIVIPVYNAEKYLVEALESAINQTYQNIEIVAVDDGSSDRSIQILESYGSKIKLVKQSNSGPAVARNRGVREAGGKWIAFLDSDDIWDLDKIRQQLDSVGSNKWCYTDSVFMGGVNDGKRDGLFNTKHSGNVFEKLIYVNFIGTSCLLIEREMFLQAGGFDEELRSIEDWELWIRLSKKNPISYIDEALVNYRIHPSSDSRGTRRTLPSHMAVINKVFGAGGVAQGYTKLRSSAKANSFGICSQIAEEEGDYFFSLRCAARALAHEPFNFRRIDRTVKVFIKSALSIIGIKL